jgi:uncharacterized protein YjbI with pentapeptide repeats
MSRVFENTLSFRNQEVTGIADYRGAEFRGAVDFSGATFKEPVRFDGARFLATANFSNASFGHNAHFTNTEFAGESNFSNAVFHAWGHFDRSRFRRDMIFSGVKFLGSANFTEVEFGADADFRKARFIAFADFPRSKFAGKADFYGASLECKTVFRDARFERQADFTDCRFTHPVNFAGAQFAAALNMDRVIFLQFVDFAGAHIKDSFVLAPPQGADGLAPEIRFESVVLDRPEAVRFRNISFEKITLMGTALRGIWFENPKWPRRGLLKSMQRVVVYDEIQKETPDPRKLATLYRDIRANLKKAGTTADLADLYYSEMEVRRKQPRSQDDKLYFLRRYLSPYTLLWLTCGYGTRPLRAVVVASAGAAAYFSYVW